MIMQAKFNFVNLIQKINNIVTMWHSISYIQLLCVNMHFFKLKNVNDLSSKWWCSGGCPDEKKTMCSLWITHVTWNTIYLKRLGEQSKQFVGKQTKQDSLEVECQRHSSIAGFRFELQWEMNRKVIQCIFFEFSSQCKT